MEQTHRKSAEKAARKKEKADNWTAVGFIAAPFTFGISLLGSLVADEVYSDQAKAQVHFLFSS